MCCFVLNGRADTARSSFAVESATCWVASASFHFHLNFDLFFCGNWQQLNHGQFDSSHPRPFRFIVSGTAGKPRGPSLRASFVRSRLRSSRATRTHQFEFGFLKRKPQTHPSNFEGSHCGSCRRLGFRPRARSNAFERDNNKEALPPGTYLILSGSNDHRFRWRDISSRRDRFVGPPRSLPIPFAKRLGGPSVT